MAKEPFKLAAEIGEGLFPETHDDADDEDRQEHNYLSEEIQQTGSAPCAISQIASKGKRNDGNGSFDPTLPYVFVNGHFNDSANVAGPESDLESEAWDDRPP